MATHVLEEIVTRAKSDSDFLERLTNSPESVISDFEAIQRRVMGAIASMSPEQAMGELLGASSNNHCPRCSCGQTSYITPARGGAFLRP